MEGKILKNNWSEMRDQISEWWGDLTDEDLDMIDGNQDQLIAVLQERYGYTRNLAFVEVKLRMASYHSKDEGRENHTNRDVRAPQFSRYDNYDNDDWPEINNGRGYLTSRTSTKVRVQGLAAQYDK